jgi:hypothetical protein
MLLLRCIIFRAQTFGALVSHPIVLIPQCIIDWTCRMRATYHLGRLVSWRTDLFCWTRGVHKSLTSFVLGARYVDVQDCAQGRATEGYTTSAAAHGVSCSANKVLIGSKTCSHRGSMRASWIRLQAPHPRPRPQPQPSMAACGLTWQTAGC